MKVVVTGAAGFVGSHFTKKLLSEGHEVLAIDNYSDYYSIELKKLRTADLIDSFGGAVQYLNLCDIEKVRKELKNYSPDSIVHLAAQPGVRLNPSEYHRYTTNNLSAFSNLYQVILELEISNFVYASSSSVYGNATNSILSESMTDLHPVSYYGASKLCNEILAGTASKISGMSAVGLRFFTVYGPYGRPDMAYFRLLAQVLSGYKFELFGDGSVLRDFTFVEDTVHALYLLLVSQQKGNFEGSHIFNIGGGKPASMLDMIAEVEKLAGRELVFEKLASFSGDVKSTHANTDKLNQAIGFIPKVSLAEGLKRTYDWSNQKEMRESLKNWAQSVD